MVLPAPEIDTSCRAGVYVRLSVEDKHTHTASIETQQLIIARYLEQNPEIIVVQTYIDNGATGTNFQRPGFQQMLSDIEAGLINCVIVKDLSRLGRNVIDTGYYIERYFPMQKVRFIAVNEYIQYIRTITQDIIGTSAYNHAVSFFCKITDDVCLSLINEIIDRIALHGSAYETVGESVMRECIFSTFSNVFFR